jgi:dihydrofolate reductase
MVACVTKTQYYTATSLDGYLADAENSLDWLFEVEGGDGPDPYPAFLADVGALAMGATTYAWVVAHENLTQEPQKWSSWYGDRHTWVFTHHELPMLPEAAITFVSGDVRPVHAAMAEAAAGRNIWLVGGGELVGSFADAGLLDEIIATIAPVTLGAGAPLLPRRLPSSRLRLTGVQRLGQMAQLTYAVTG